jgi:hypothetical protein
VSRESVQSAGGGRRAGIRHWRSSQAPLVRMAERGASEAEVVATVTGGERLAARDGRTAFRRNFAFSGEWRHRAHQNKQIEVFAAREPDGWLILTVVVKYF